LSSIITNFFKTLSSSRLKDTLEASKIDIENITEEAIKAKKTDVWIEKTKLALHEAEEALKNGYVEAGWRLLNEAELLSIYGYSNSRLINNAKATAREAKLKLKDWRKETVQEILSDKAIEKGITADDLFVARETLKEHYNNIHLKNALLQDQIVVLTIIALICLIISIILLPLIPSDVMFQNYGFLAVVAIFGALGGSISGVTSINKASKEENVPDLVLNYWITVLRPVIGASSALVIVLFLVSGLLKIGEMSEFSRELLISVSFISGFSEKVLLSVVEKFPK